MTNNRFIDNLNSDTNPRAEAHPAMATDTDAGAARAGHGFSTQQVAVAESQVVQTGVLNKLTEWRFDDRGDTGTRARPAFVSDRAILVGFLLLASEHRPLWISSLAELFQNDLTAESRTLLDLPALVVDDAHANKRWYTGTYRAVHRMLASMDPFPQNHRRASTHTEVQAVLDAHDTDREKKMKARLDEFTEGFLHMTFLQQAPHLQHATRHIDLAIEQAFVASPTRRGFAKTNLAQKIAAEHTAGLQTLRPGPVDVFAGWWVDRKDNDRHDFGWGWAANIAVRVDSERPGESRFPKLAISATLSMPNVGVAEEAISLMRSARGTGLAPGVVDADLQYWANSRRERLYEPATELGFTPSTDYRPEQLGLRGGRAGADFIEGKAYCPSMPAPLQNASKDRRGDVIDELSYQNRLRARVYFELRPKGKPDSKGRVRVLCPAAGNSPTVTCSLRKTTDAGRGKPRPHIAEEDHPDYLDKICSQQSVTLDSRDGLQRQAFTFGSQTWHDFHAHARKAAEDLTANIHNHYRENLGKSSRRSVRGFAAAQVFVTVLLTNYNLRELAAFMDDEDRER
ncbi:hypothetical protein B7495_06050 [Cryobacterium sp. LW097]|nr:hypothetical protein B7495_06050 [Cryobacterium sp. LW097]